MGLIAAVAKGQVAPLPLAAIIALAVMFLAPRNLFERGWKLRDRPPRVIGGKPRRRRQPRPRPPAKLRGQVYRPAAGTVVRRGRGTVHQMPERPWLTPGYRAYMAGQIVGFDGLTWPERMRGFLAAHRRGPARGACELHYPGVCEGQAYQGNHLDYTELYQETRRTVQLVCGSCHVVFERAKDAARAGGRW